MFCAISRVMIAPNSSVVPPIGSMPFFFSRSATSGELTARFTAAASFSMTGFGVPAGVTKPIHSTPSYPGNPISATVGTSGICDERFAPA